MSRYAACLCTDRKMMVPALFAASEIKARSRAIGNDLDVIIFTPPGEFDAVARDWMTARDIRLDESFDTAKWSGLVQDRRLHPVTLIRLMLANHLAGRYEKFLYLDSDITVHQPVDAIFRLDTGEAPLAACAASPIQGSPEVRAQAETHLSAIGMTPPYAFFNSGVLLVDVAKWNAMDLGKRALARVQSDPKLYWLPDEHGLNGELNGKFTEVSPLWNARILSYSDPEFRAAIDPVIVHYDGRRKPWKRYGKEKRFRQAPIGYEHFARFVKGTPWKGWLRAQWTPLDFIKSIREEWRQRGDRPSPEEAWRMKRGISPGASKVPTILTQPYADVEQGIATRTGGVLRLAPV